MTIARKLALVFGTFVLLWIVSGIINFKQIMIIGRYLSEIDRIDASAIDAALIHQDLQSSQGQAHQAVRIAIVVTSILLVTGIIVVGSAAVIARRISSRITRLKEEAGEIGQGGLDTRVGKQPQEGAVQDEIEELNRALGGMVESWRVIVQKLLDGASRLASAATEIAAAAGEMSQGADSQSNQVIATSSAMEEMSCSIQEVSRNAQSTLQAALAASDLARGGGARVQQTVSGIAMANETMQTLQRRSQEIGTVVQLIGEIAAQTNILALNAAIEAARAGEHGRGFDVVAEEIRKLAQRTTQSTDEIAVSIAEIQRDTQETVRLMGTATTLAQEMGQAFEELVEGIVSTTDMLKLISSASTQQTKTSEEIAEALQHISTVSQQTAQGSREVARATQDLTALADQLQGITRHFRL